MQTLDDFFRASADIPSHPRLRDWKQRLSRSGVTAELELYQAPSALGFAQTEMNLRFIENNSPQPLETMAWDDDLNAGLIGLGVRAISVDHESLRFALGLRTALRKVEREFGDGYLNSVLFEFVNDSDLGRYPEVADVVKHAYALSPHKDGKSYKRFREMIADAIGARAHELKDNFHYDDAEAKQILVKAIGRYLDERFSVSSRRRLGLL